MSHRGIAWAWRQPVADMAERTILLALGETHGHEDGLCFPSLQTLAEMARTSKRRVVRTLSRLEAAGLIEVDRGGGRRSSFYTLVGLDSVTPVEPQAQMPRSRSGDPGGTTSDSVVVTPVEPQAQRPRSRSGSTVGTAAGAKTARSGSTGGTLTSHQEYHQERARAGARDCSADFIDVGEWEPGAELLRRLLDQRPEMTDHWKPMLEKLRGRYAGRRLPAAEWGAKFTAWFGREDLGRLPAPEAPHPVTAKEAQRRQRPPRPPNAVACGMCNGGLDGCYFCGGLGWVTAETSSAGGAP